MPTTLLLWAQAGTATPFPTSSLLIMGAAAVGLIVNTLAVLTVAWRGGQIIGTVTHTLSQLTEEVHALRLSRDEHAVMLARAVAQLDDMERRVTANERRHDILESRQNESQRESARSER